MADKTPVDLVLLAASDVAAGFGHEWASISPLMNVGLNPRRNHPMLLVKLDGKRKKIHSPSHTLKPSPLQLVYVRMNFPEEKARGK